MIKEYQSSPPESESQVETIEQLQEQIDQLKKEIKPFSYSLSVQLFESNLFKYEIKLSTTRGDEKVQIEQELASFIASSTESEIIDRFYKLRQQIDELESKARAIRQEKKNKEEALLLERDKKRLEIFKQKVEKEIEERNHKLGELVEKHITPLKQFGMTEDAIKNQLGFAQKSEMDLYQLIIDQLLDMQVRIEELDGYLAQGSILGNETFDRIEKDYQEIFKWVPGGHA